MILSCHLAHVDSAKIVGFNIYLFTNFHVIHSSKSEWNQGSITTQADLLHQQKSQAFILW